MMNPALVEQPRSQASTLIVREQNSSIMDWLEENGRFIPGDEAGPNWSLDDELLSDTLLIAGQNNYNDDSDL